MVDQTTIIFVIIGSVVAMLMIGGGIIGATFIIRPKMLLRQRMNQIGMIGDGIITSVNTTRPLSVNSVKPTRWLGSAGSFDVTEGSAQTSSLMTATASASGPS